MTFTIPLHPQAQLCLDAVVARGRSLGYGLRTADGFRRD